MWFMDDLRSRLANRVQLTSDGHKAYLEAVEGAFGSDIDYAQLIKIYGASPESAKGRYSPVDCTSVEKTKIEGSLDLAHVSTSYVERSNLTMRMHMRRFTRLTDGLSVALQMMYYNFVRIHAKLRISPAMAAGVSDKLWEVADIVALVANSENRPTKRGLYKNGPKMKILASEELRSLEWLVENRSRNQQSALEVYKIIERENKKLSRSRRHRAFAHCLLGICFSLWRAVFLANLKQDKGALLKDATSFLRELIETNNISFQTDVRNKEWSFRYYVQNARDRLKYLNASFSHKKLSFDLPGESVGKTPQEWWEAHQDSLDDAIKAFDHLLKLNRPKETSN
jgi:hypothetical protein